MARIGIGIPVFQSFVPQVAFDYMRMFYSFGRRYPDHEFFLLNRVKSEQFRARNGIVETALQFGMDYLLFLDDDHIINWRETNESSQYDFLQKLLDHKKDIVGCLYYHRTGEYKPVLMKEFEEGKYRFLTDNEIIGGLQEVDVQGGGCMLIDMKVFNRIKPPYFEPEQQSDGQSLGTDIQLCRKAKAEGFKVWCDTSIVIGHLKQDQEIVTHLNRDSFFADNLLKTGIGDEWAGDFFIKEFQENIKEYLQMSDTEILDIAATEREKNARDFPKYKDIKDYYISRGKDQVCRQFMYHSKMEVIREGLTLLKKFKKGLNTQGIDYGCGTAPIGYELVKMGHNMDFVDIDGAGAYEFLKWRVANKLHEKLRKRVGWKVQGPYDFALFLDSIEHFRNWEEILDNIIGRLHEGGMLITNYFGNRDFMNVEHVNMNHKAVMEFLISRNMIPRTYVFWQKDDNYMGGAMSVKHNQEVING